jgi:hypothetical protein
MLEMDSYSRRIVLNNWLEQLSRQNARPEMIHSLSYLFDDSVADKSLSLLKK